MIVLQEDEAVLLRAVESYTCPITEKNYKSGETWMIRGPLDFIPPIEIQILENRKAIPLAENEGVYVRESKTGEVKLVRGPVTYMLSEKEQPWEKILPDQVELLLNSGGYVPLQVDDKGNQYYSYKSVNKRDKTRAVTFKAPHNSAVQLFDFKSGKSRIVFGPELIILEPYEEFTVLTLSGGVPKKEA